MMGGGARCPVGSEVDMFRIYAHRGASAVLPENTMPAFLHALEAGVDALETDVHVSRDGVVMVHHDTSFVRSCGVDRPVVEMDRAEIEDLDAGWGFKAAHGRPFAGRGYRVPTLAELLRATAQAGCRINVDVKVESGSSGLVGAWSGQVSAAARDAVARVIACVREGGAEERVTLTSVSDGIVSEVVRQGYRGEVGTGKWGALGAMLLGKMPAGTALQIPWKYKGIRWDRPGLVRRARALGLRVDFWTVNDPELARRLVEIGADGIMTDDPDRVVAATREALARRCG